MMGRKQRVCPMEQDVLKKFLLHKVELYLCITQNEEEDSSGVVG